MYLHGLRPIQRRSNSSASFSSVGEGTYTFSFNEVEDKEEKDRLEAGNANSTTLRPSLASQLSHSPTVAVSKAQTPIRISKSRSRQETSNKSDLRRPLTISEQEEKEDMSERGSQSSFRASSVSSMTADLSHPAPTLVRLPSLF